VNEFERLHASLQYHLVNTLGWSALRPAQQAAITPIHAGTHCLLLAPTAGGKTEAAVIPILSRMLIEAWPATSVLYVCPIKALLNNLEPRLSQYAGLIGRRVEVWHGDIGQSRKKRSLKNAPDILLTTPESIEAMLISARIDRHAWFGHLQAVIVDELHAFASDDRGWHLRSVLHRLDQYLNRPVQRIGLSATVSNPSDLLAWFAPEGDKEVVGRASVSVDADVTIDHVGSLENAATVIASLHRGEKRLVFCDTRSGAEQLGSMLRTQGIRTFVSHSSLSLSERQRAEVAFSEERDCVIVATSTLELGIDVGDLDRVIQIDSPPSVSSFLQRMGRTGRRSTGSRRNCLFLTTNEYAFLLALGVTQKWSEGWVEAAVPPPEPWHIVAQQALAVSLERGDVPKRELTGLLHGSFPELPVADIEMLIEHMIHQRFLDSADEVVQVGSQTERNYARGHYRDLLAAFSGTPLLTGRHGASEVGYIDPTVLTAQGDEAMLLLLAGRSWRVTGIEWSKRIVWLEPAPSGGHARWLGGARSVEREVCQGVLSVLRDGPSPLIVLSRRASATREALARDILAASDQGYASSSATKAAGRTWTFAGTRANRTLAHFARDAGSKVGFDAFSVQTPPTGLPKSLPDRIVLTDGELATFSASIKFAPCIPSPLLERTVAKRTFEIMDTPPQGAGWSVSASARRLQCRSIRQHI
jgi:ATP-dependent Lhr-like helicase